MMLQQTNLPEYNPSQIRVHKLNIANAIVALPFEYKAEDNFTLSEQHNDLLRNIIEITKSGLLWKVI